jgi:2-C-methyl-D-erythritol 2,4-cyclodiphosphate synthase
MIRIGHGYDVHAFGGDKPLRLGGITIKDSKGLIAHSDGDVVLHALCDALLGASALNDIGYHFPDTDPRYSGISSLYLLKEVKTLIEKKGLWINNLDITIIAQIPRLAPYITLMKKAIVNVLSISEEQCNIKATTTEQLGYIGRKEGIAVHCVCLLNTSKCC